MLNTHVSAKCMALVGTQELSPSLFPLLWETGYTSHQTQATSFLVHMRRLRSSRDEKGLAQGNSTTSQAVIQSVSFDLKQISVRVLAENSEIFSEPPEFSCMCRGEVGKMQHSEDPADMMPLRLGSQTVHQAVGWWTWQSAGPASCPSHDELGHLLWGLCTLEAERSKRSYFLRLPQVGNMALPLFNFWLCL